MHTREVQNERVNSFKCGNCDESFSAEKDLATHIKTMHSNTKFKNKQTDNVELSKFQCEQCNKTFTHKPNLFRHI